MRTKEIKATMQSPFVESKGGYVKSSTHEHTHGPDYVLMEPYAITMNTKIKKDAATCTDASTQKLLSSAIVHTTPEGYSKMPVVNNIKRRIRGFSHENRCRLPIPTILDFELLVKYMQTLIEKKILSEGSVVPWSENRYLVRATSNNIDVLNSNGNWSIGPDTFYHSTRSTQCIILLTSAFTRFFPKRLGT